MTYGIGLNALAVLAVVACMAGCAHKPPRVDCDGKLQPINLPAPVERGSTSQPPTDPKQSLRTVPQESRSAASNPSTGLSQVSPDEQGRSP